MSAPGEAAPTPERKHPAQLGNTDLRKRANAAVKRLRAHPPAEPLTGEALTWLAELVQTLANRLPYPRVQVAKHGRR